MIPAQVYCETREALRSKSFYHADLGCLGVRSYIIYFMIFSVLIDDKNLDENCLKDSCRLQQ